MPIDLLFMIAFALGFRHGYSTGIIGTIFNVVAYIFGILLAFKITPAMSNILERLFNSQNPTMFLLAFIVNVAIIMLVLKQLARFLEGILHLAHLGIFNRVFGGALMAGVGILIYSILLWFAVRVNMVNDATIAESRTYVILKDLPGEAKAVGLRFQPFAREMWDASLDWMDKFENYGVKKTESLPKVYEIPDNGKPIETEPQERTVSPRPRPAPTSPDNGIEE